MFEAFQDVQWFSMTVFKTPNVSASRLSPPPPPGCCVAHSRPQRARTLARKGNGVRGSSVQVFLGTSQRYVVYIIYTITHLRKIDRFFVFTPKKVGMRFSRYIYISVQSWAFRLDISKSKYLRHDACPTTETTTDLGVSQGSLELIHDGPWD